MGFHAWKYLPPVLGVLFCGQAISQPAADPGKNAPEVQLLVYNGAKIPERVMEQAGVEAVRIFAVAGIRLDWLSCPARGPEVCRLGNARNRFVLHVLPREKASSDSAYGEAFLGDDGVGRYADAFFDRIEQTHRESRVDPSRLLGAVAAHELGHLLLGSRSHSWVGIMSPTWSGDNLKRVAMGTMYFTEDQSRRIKQRMLIGEGMRMNLAAKEGDY